jgi:hypothetical protein
MTTEGNHADVAFNDPIEPRLLPVGSAKVECHLYDPEALAEAERIRAST